MYGLACDNVVNYEVCISSTVILMYLTFVLVGCPR